jgi:hypothetical protein
MLDTEEYVEQAYYYRTLRERMQEGMSTQELLIGISHEVLSTTKLPMALQFMATELQATGGFASAMDRLPHYFSPFQTYVIRAAEEATGRFDFRIALEILQHEAEYRAKDVPLQGVFFYQFETLCRNRLRYDLGLDAMAADPLYNEDWREWLQTVRHQIGIIDFADMIYVRSHYYKRKANDPDVPVLFGEKEGRIALANRRKNPAFLFAALARHLGYPSVPRPKPLDDKANLLPLLRGRVDRMELRIKLLEEELRGGIDISKFYGTPDKKS